MTTVSQVLSFDVVKLAELVHHSIAGDYNKHLSNSSYAKVGLTEKSVGDVIDFRMHQNLDYARLKASVEMFAPFFAPGGWMALGGLFFCIFSIACKLTPLIFLSVLTAASYQFAKEIPIFADYEIHVSIGGFEEKWASQSNEFSRAGWISQLLQICEQLYLVAEFVTYPKKGKSSQKTVRDPASHKPTSALQADKSDSTKPTVQPMLTEVLSGSAASSGDVTPTSNVTSTNGTSSMQEQIAKRVAQTVRTDGSVLHCLGVSSYCFKVGRITIPPVSPVENLPVVSAKASGDDLACCSFLQWLRTAVKLGPGGEDYNWFKRQGKEVAAGWMEGRSGRGWQGIRRTRVEQEGETSGRQIGRGI